jgi:hypothetical protein
MGDDDVDALPDQLVGKLLGAIALPPSIMELHCDVLA